MDQSTPHQLINYAMDFHMPSCIKNMVASYFNDLQMCFALQDFTTGCQQLEEGIAMGCAISSILFVAAFEVILVGARQMVGGVKLQETTPTEDVNGRCHQPPSDSSMHIKTAKKGWMS